VLEGERAVQLLRANGSKAPRETRGKKKKHRETETELEGAQIRSSKGGEAKLEAGSHDSQRKKQEGQDGESFLQRECRSWERRWYGGRLEIG